MLATGGVSGFTNVLRAGTKEFLAKFGEAAGFYPPITHPTMVYSAGIGVLFGIAVGYFDPEQDRFVDLWNAINTATLATTAAFVKGVSSVEGGAQVYGLLSGPAEAFLVNRVAGGGIIAVSFAVGFTAGYFLGHEVRLLLS